MYWPSGLLITKLQMRRTTAQALRMFRVDADDRVLLGVAGRPPRDVGQLQRVAAADQGACRETLHLGSVVPHLVGQKRALLRLDLGAPRLLRLVRELVQRAHVGVPGVGHVGKARVHLAAGDDVNRHALPALAVAVARNVEGAVAVGNGGGVVALLHEGRDLELLAERVGDQHLLAEALVHLHGLVAQSRRAVDLDLRVRHRRLGRSLVDRQHVDDGAVGLVNDDLVVDLGHVQVPAVLGPGGGHEHGENLVGGAQNDLVRRRGRALGGRPRLLLAVNRKQVVHDAVVVVGGGPVVVELRAGGLQVHLRLRRDVVHALVVDAQLAAPHQVDARHLAPAEVQLRELAEGDLAQQLPSRQRLDAPLVERVVARALAVAALVHHPLLAHLGVLLLSRHEHGLLLHLLLVEGLRRLLGHRLAAVGLQVLGLHQGPSVDGLELHLLVEHHGVGLAAVAAGVADALLVREVREVADADLPVHLQVGLQRELVEAAEARIHGLLVGLVWAPAGGVEIRHDLEARHLGIVSARRYSGSARAADASRTLSVARAGKGAEGRDHKQACFWPRLVRGISLNPLEWCLVARGSPRVRWHHVGSCITQPRGRGVAAWGCWSLFCGSRNYLRRLFIVWGCFAVRCFLVIRWLLPSSAVLGRVWACAP
ncbi:proteasome ATPase [Babesia caballi]|uniref:Proteasome ATPase n=1 Tax=Babesia caballi TaxID=5871 RepID=A0AAV4LQ98_BABCB|nr:proteasome ATPase [Babesia caballi]